MVISWHIGDAVRKIRGARNLTHMELATLAHVNVGTLQKLESGGNTQVRTLEKIAAALATDVASLYQILPNPITITDIGTTAAVVDRRVVNT